MDKDSARAIADFERLGLLALKLKELDANLEQREAELKGAEKRKKDAETAVASANAQVAAKQKELHDLEASILVVNERLAKDKNEARASFDNFVAGIKSEERAIQAAVKKRQADFEEFKRLIDKEEQDRQVKFDKMVASHDKWKKDHGLA